MATQQAMLEAFAPEFVGDSRLSLALELAAQQMASETIWGAVYDQAVALLAAHLLTGWGPAAGSGSGVAAGQNAGPVTSETAGDVSRSYGHVTSNIAGGASITDALLAATTHGRAFLALRKGRAAGSPGLVLAGPATARRVG